MNKNILHLTGGLGNQLFQLSAGLSFTSNQDLIISAKNGKPRLNEFGEPDLFSFEMPDRVRVLEEDFSGFLSRVFGYVIRAGVSPRKIEKLRTFQFLVRLLASILASAHYKKLSKVMKVNGVGYVGMRKHSNLFIGYFQTFKYAEEPTVYEKLRSLQLKNSGDQFNNLLPKIISSKTIVVHLRRGDYLNETSFGILGSEYYFDCVNELLKMDIYDSVWIFSDDLSAARELFEGKFDVECNFIGDVDNSSASVLELMRFGSAYVIGNSSFSWWGAFLRHDLSAPVYAPIPWFIGQPEPELLIPGDWIRRNGHHFSHSPVELAND